MQKKILIVVDVQNGFVDKVDFSVVEKIRELSCSHEFDRVIQTQFKNVSGSNYEKLMGWKGMLTEEEQECFLDVTTFEKFGYFGLTKAILGSIPTPDDCEIILCGIDTECCVLATALQAFELGYRVKVVTDCCCSTGGEAVHEAGLTVIARLLGKAALVSSSDYLGGAEC